jgi:hypothetical protein
VPQTFGRQYGFIILPTFFVWRSVQFAIARLCTRPSATIARVPTDNTVSFSQHWFIWHSLAGSSGGERCDQNITLLRADQREMDGQNSGPSLSTIKPGHPLLCGIADAYDFDEQ